MRRTQKTSSPRRLLLVAVVASLGGLATGLALAPRAAPLYAGPGWQPSRAAAVNRDEPYPKLDVFAKVLSYIKNNYVEPVDESTLVYGAVRGMVATLDPHTVFMDPAEYRSMRADTAGEFGGLGLELAEREGQLVVLAPLEDTPAARAGILAGDVIRAIDGQGTRQMTVVQAASRLKGTAGTQVTLRLWREGFTAPRDMVLVRDRIRVGSVESRLLDGGIGYVRIKSFQDRTDQQLAQALAALRQQAARQWKGLVLDLRNNPGGLLEQGVRVADRFLEEGVIVTTRGRDGRNAEQETASKKGTESDYPLAVLVNAGTASASEIVAGALQDQARGVLFGEPTYGKGSVQTVIELDDGSGLKLTIARYYTPGGRSIQESGIAPDVAVSSTAADAQVTREATLPGHMPNDGSGKTAAVVTVDAARVLPSGPTTAPVEDAQLDAAVRALSGWRAFSKNLERERSQGR